MRSIIYCVLVSVILLLGDVMASQPQIDCNADLARIEQILLRAKITANTAKRYDQLRSKALTEIRLGQFDKCTATIAQIRILLGVDSR
jgi:hypothetical protein